MVRHCCVYCFMLVLIRCGVMVESYHSHYGYGIKLRYLVRYVLLKLARLQHDKFKIQNCTWRRVSHTDGNPTDMLGLVYELAFNYSQHLMLTRIRDSPLDAYIETGSKCRISCDGDDFCLLAESSFCNWRSWPQIVLDIYRRYSTMTSNPEQQGQCVSGQSLNLKDGH